MTDRSAPPSDIDSRVDRVLARALVPWERSLRRVLPKFWVRAATEFLVFGIKQAWACLFGGLILAGLIGTALFWPENAPLARYDFLVIYAVGIQLAFLALKLERWDEAVVILIFHAVGTAMELFKTEMGSWTYPEDSVLRIGEVPLFTGFMYAAVGSYIARGTRVFGLAYTHYPRRRWTVVLGALIYLNFFAHHYWIDIRWGLFAFAAILYGRTWIHYRVWRFGHRMPLLLGFTLVALFIWIAENIGTLTGTWFYPDQVEGWKPVSIMKMGSWWLLMLLSWVLVTLVHAPAVARQAGARDMLSMRRVRPSMTAANRRARPQSSRPT